MQLNGKLEGILVYVQLAEPVACYEAVKGTEWKASIVVDEDTADAWDEIAGKQGATAVKTSDFETKYKIEAPFPEQKKQFIITLKQNTKTAAGEDFPEKYRPRVYQKQGATLVDITKQYLVANGSKGVISFKELDTQYGKTYRLQNILVTELIEYVQTEGDYTPGSEFDSSSESPSATPVTKPATAPKKTAKAATLEDDAPF